MNDKFQKALNRIVKSSCPNCHDENGCASCDIEKICNATAKYWVNTLQELIDQNKVYTLEEVKKMWEELGYTWKKVGDYHDGTEYTKYIIEKKLTYSCRINLYCQNKTYSTYRYFETTREGYPDYKIYEFDLTIEEHQLLNKTLKALGWFDENR